VQQSNGYVIGFAALLTIVLGGALSVAAVLLREPQKKAVELDTKQQILSAVMDTESFTKEEVAKIYEDRIRSIVVNSQGEEITDYGFAKPEDVNIKKEYKKKDLSKKNFPVFKLMKEGSSEEVEAYIIPVYGFGLWDDIWGFVALESDFNTVKGISLGHKGETPGLGARITTPEVQQRYKGKKIFDGDELVSVKMVKGENNTGLNEHQVDGMSGATITGNGVNEMLMNYFNYYRNYFEKAKSNS